MGFYLQTLREEEEFMGNTGFDSDGIATPDDKYEVELSDVAQTIEDINTDYADQSSQEELDGQVAGLAKNPVEECMIAMAECEHNWNAIMQAIGTREIQEASRGREMVMEAVDIKGFFNRAKEFFVKMFKKITAIVKNWLENASATFRTNKSFADKYGSKLADGQKAYNAKSNSKAFKGYTFRKNGQDLRKAANEFVSKQQEHNSTVTAAANKLTSDLESGNSAYSKINRFAQDNNLDVDAFRAKMCGRSSGTVSASDYSDALKEAFFGSKEKVTLTEIKPDDLITVLKGSEFDIKAIKKAYATMKKGFDDILKALKKLENAVNKSQDKGHYTENRSSAMKNVTYFITKVKEMKSAGTMSLSMMMKAIKAEKAQARKIANAYIYALNASDRKDTIDKLDKGIKESGFLAGVELI